MKKAILHNIITGKEIKVHLTLDHPAALGSVAVWVDNDNRAYFPEDERNPFYEIKEISED